MSIWWTTSWANWMLTKRCAETVQVTDTSARQSRINWGRFISVSCQKLLAKGLTHELVLCTGMNIHGLSISWHKLDYLEITDLWEIKTTKKKSTNLLKLKLLFRGAFWHFCSLCHCVLELWAVASILPDTFAIAVADFCYNGCINIKTMLLNAQLYCKPILSNALKGFVASAVEKKLCRCQRPATTFFITSEIEESN